MVRLLGFEAVLEVVDPPLDLGVDQRRRRIRRRPARPAASTAPLRSAMAAWTRLTSPIRLAMSARSSSTVSNSDASPAHSSVTSGRTFSLTSLTSTRKVAGPSGSFGVEGQDVAGPGAVERSSSSGRTAAAAQLVEEVVGRHARRRAPRRGSRCRSMVRWSPSRAGRLDRGQLAEIATQPVDLGVDLLVGDLGARDLDPQTVVAGQVQLGADLHHGVERHRAGLLTGRDVDLRGRRWRRRRARARPASSSRAGRRAGPRSCPVSLPSRASRIRRGALPGRKPGIRTSRAILRKAASTAFSNSCSSTSTDNFTLLPSSGSTTAFIASTESRGRRRQGGRLTGRGRAQ